MTRARYIILRVTDVYVLIQDLNIGMSVTNDAEAVVAEILSHHPGKCIYYYDTENQLAELCHHDGKFIGFGHLDATQIK